MAAATPRTRPTSLTIFHYNKVSMFRSLPLFLLGALLLAGADVPQPKSAFDKPTLEAYVRHLFLLRPELTVQVLDPKPSELLPGYSEVRVRVSQGNASQE